MWEVEGTRQTGCPKKTSWDCVKNDMESLGMDICQMNNSQAVVRQLWSLAD